MVGVLLRNAIVSCQVLAFGCLDGCAVFQLVTQLRMETVLIGNVLHCPHLVLGIHIGEGATNHTRSIGYLCMLAIHMTGSTTSLIAEHIRTGWGMRLRCGIHMLQMRYIRPTSADGECTNDLQTLKRKLSMLFTLITMSMSHQDQKLLHVLCVSCSNYAGKLKTAWQFLVVFVVVEVTKTT